MTEDWKTETAGEAASETPATDSAPAEAAPIVQKLFEPDEQERLRRKLRNDSIDHGSGLGRFRLT